MAAEWLTAAKGITGIADKIFGSLAKFGKLKAEKRKRVAKLLDSVASEVLIISKQMDRKEISNKICEQIFTYSLRLPPLLERAYDKDVAEQLGSELKLVYEARQSARAILANPKLQRSGRNQIKALRTTVDAAAGRIIATANILRAM
jgi:hypothetical protein